MEKEKTIGVLKLNTRFPRIAGDIGNPDSFQYPVSYCTVESAVPANITVADTLPEPLQQAFFKSAQKLIDENVSIITTTCGFLATLQKQLTSLSDTPVICSSLALLPLLKQVHGGVDYIGVLTFNRDTLNHNHFGSTQPGCIEGLQPADTLRQVIEQDLTQLDEAMAEKEVLAACSRLIKSKPDTRAIILECTNLSPYKQAIREQFAIAVYDIVDAVHWLLESANTNATPGMHP